MINAPSPDESDVVIVRLAPDVTDAQLDRVAEAILGDARHIGATIIRRLRALVDACVPEQPRGAVQLGALPEILGTAVTLQYPLIELERYLTGEQSDIGDPRQAELYLSFVRHHLWKLEQLTRPSVDARL